MAVAAVSSRTSTSIAATSPLRLARRLLRGCAVHVHRRHARALAPNSCTVARPILEPAPVTTAILPGELHARRPTRNLIEFTNVPADCEEEDERSLEDQPRHLGARADGNPLRAGGLSTRARRRDDGATGAPGRRGARRPHRRLRVPLPAGTLGGESRRRSQRARQARRLLPRDRAAPRPALRPRRPGLAGRGDA